METDKAENIEKVRTLEGARGYDKSVITVSSHKESTTW